MQLLAWGPISEQGGDCPTMNQGTRFSKEVQVSYQQDKRQLCPAASTM
jgi:hypothetical protein